MSSLLIYAYWCAQILTLTLYHQIILFELTAGNLECQPCLTQRRRGTLPRKEETQQGQDPLPAKPVPILMPIGSLPYWRRISPVSPVFTVFLCYRRTWEVQALGLPSQWRGLGYMQYIDQTCTRCSMRHLLRGKRCRTCSYVKWATP